ncbi:MAG: hypothetical protein KDD82_30240 [Planctomycetes bacterium]|nr:hypothetical protein [Planctomycetota bacterium]
MKRFAASLLGALLLAGGLATPAVAQGGGDLQGKLDKKLAEGWIKDPLWITDYDEAKQKAGESGKLIFGYFTRSYSY